MSLSPITLSLALVAGLWSAVSWAALSPLYKPASALGPNQLAIIVNDLDPQSREVAAYYQQQRHIPANQLIHVRFPPRQAVMSQKQFNAIKQQVDKLTPKQVQAYALSWTMPFRVDCMSITTAFASGFSEAYCAQGCKTTLASPYFGSEQSKPYDKHGLRPTMMLAGDNVEEVKKLIDRGVAADFTQPQGSAYLLKTSDVARSSRAAAFPDIALSFQNFWRVNYLEQDYIEGHDDVMFYFTGLKVVSHIKDNHYLPGAIADHLTSAGGILSGSQQMSILEWLKAGVTGSYGAVVEPCNFPAKFPNPGLVMYNYLRGSSLIEAYWKSVGQPGQGLFVGEPLAKPFAFKAVKK